MLADSLASVSTLEALSPESSDKDLILSCSESPSISDSKSLDTSLSIISEELPSLSGVKSMIPFSSITTSSETFP